MEQQLKVNRRQQKDFGVIELIGDVTTLAEEPVMSAYHELDAGGAKKILLKFNQASYINSAGLAIIIGVVSDARKKKQPVGVFGLSSHFKKVFDMIGLTDYLSVFETEEEALRMP